MKRQSGLRGVWAAVLTPINAQMLPDSRKGVEYYNDLLGRGIDGLNVLGTNGEAASFGTHERLRYMEAVAGRVPTDRAIAGTGTTSLADTVRLTQAAFDCGYLGALVMPPFFYRPVNDDGVVGFFDALLTRLGTPDPQLILYNFPSASGVTFHAALVERLVAEFPGAIAGMKDSSNDRALQQAILAKHPDFAILPSSEEHLAGARADGTSGCISGSVALWPELAQRVWQTGAGAEHLAELRRSVAGPELLLRVRYLTSRARNDESWERPMPPLVSLSAAEKRNLDAVLTPRV
ncbi:MAG: dihydrodipicolinate synthase family protein [Candidatus Eremiobacteraeota bacterium]|nr:dihydrodipicolinate synthase family protein [Candidatus Eremiobacteraeota bacterium]